MKTVFGLITSASAQQTKDGKSIFMLDVVDKRTMGASKQFLSPKVAAHALTGDSSSEIDASDLRGKYLSASCHEVGDILHDNSEATTDSLINNSTVTFLTKEQVKELMS
jgi:hypothetical protein